MNRTKIDYLNYTWNPTAGCRGLGCAVREKCWAWFQLKRQKPQANGRGCQLCYEFIPHVHSERLDEPLSLSKASRIGVSFCGDLYDRDIDPHYRRRTFSIVNKCARHRFLVLTKQPQNLFFEPYSYPSNLAVGVSVNVYKDKWRIDTLRGAPVNLRVVSFEPLYEDLGEVNLEDIGWIIIGAQTRPTFIPETEWVTSLIKQAHARDNPVFIKRNYSKFNLEEYPESWKAMS